MTQDDVIRLAKEAGASIFVTKDGASVGLTKFEKLEAFAKLVAAQATEHEREACARLAQKTVCDTHLPTGVKIYGTAAAKAIRARGQT